MTIDAIAVLPPIALLESAVLQDGWHERTGPGGTRGAVRRLRDGILVNLALSIQAPDADLFEAARRWTDRPPARIWVFPDAAVPDEATASAVRAATRDVGRWVKRGAAQRTLLEDLGLTRGEAEAVRREMNSGDPARVAAAVAAFEQRMAGKDPAEIEALLAAFLRRA